MEIYKNIVICDIDGTIANLENRIGYLYPEKGQKKDWEKFHSSISDDSPYFDMLRILKALINQRERVLDLLYVSGRPEKNREKTLDWLERWGFPKGDLYMRANNDFRPDDIIKEEIIDSLKLSTESVLCILDDRDRVVKMWRRKGFRCLQVADGNF